MSEEDYKSGLRGDTYQFGMNQISYEAGAAKRKQQEGSQFSGPKTEVDGVGFTMIMMSPFLAIMYPIAGFITVAGTLLLLKITSFLPGILRVIIGLGGFGYIFAHALKVEHKVSNHQLYRVSRHILRLALIGTLAFSGILQANRYGSFERAFNNASGGQIFFVLMVILAMHFIFPMLDRKFFPVLDSKTRAKVKKYEGMTEDETFSIKNAKFNGLKKFALVWLGISIAIGCTLAKIGLSKTPVILIGLASYAICHKMRNQWFFKLSNERYAAAKNKTAAAPQAEEEPAPAQV